MPEGDTIFRAARTLHRALAGKVVMSFETVLPQLDRVHVDNPVTGRTVKSVTSQGKWMVMEFSGDLYLLTHMLMNGSWHIYRPGEVWQRSRSQMRIVIGSDDYVAVGFNVPIAEFHSARSLRRHSGFRRLGLDVLGEGFDEARAKAQLRSRGELTVEEALLRQSLLAGIGNVFKSEICFACGVHPLRLIASLKEDELDCIVRTARRLLLANVADSAGMRRTTGRLNPEERLWVYGRRNAPCRRCGTPIQSQKSGLGVRTTFWCPRCQPLG